MNIFIGNLPYKIEESELMELFADYGEVTSLKIIIDRETGRSKGFGFAEMSDKESALKAIEDLNAAEIYGRNIVVKEAEPKAEGARKPFRSGGGSGGYKGGGGYNKSSYGDKDR
ncbi:RNA-binding protein [Mucilaginibacter sp. HMF5004]|uniref:RNA recognition motif domain-containing protein n=1 Tax=Mucilaginibacter rivuli TaxID=2857527 RepID=UPI001C5DBE0D|nr:RNA-binding protein [Mucilaginibacter rivuli]MBW4889462.1 RNA-binding protein [Mucilaginibacter rivuli]